MLWGSPGLLLSQYHVDANVIHILNITNIEIKMGGRTIYRTLSPKRTPFQTGIDRWPHLWMMPGNRWICHRHPMWLWGHSLFKILSPGPVFYETKWLLWRPYKPSPTFHLKCRIDTGLIKKGKHNWSLKVAMQGLDYGPPLMHSSIQQILNELNSENSNIRWN
jgi:hypothetical protein